MKKLVIILFTVLPLLSACLEMQSVYDNPGKELMAVSAVSGVPTKAPVPGSTFSTSRVMTLSAWYNAPQSGTSENYFSAQTFRYNTASSLWMASDCYWPHLGTLSLLAWSLDDGTNTLTPTSINWVSSNYTDGVTLALPDNSTKQVDVMFAGKADATKNNNALVFRHALSWLEFQVTSNTPDVITLTGITVRNVYHSGSLTAARSGDEVEFSWKSLATQEDRNVAFSPMTLGTTWQTVGNGLLILPQLQIKSATTKTCFVVHYTVPYGDGGAPIAKSRICYFGDDAWQAGSKYIYKLNFTLDNLTVTTEVTPWANAVEPVNPVEVVPTDLSMVDIHGTAQATRSTANSYVVSTTGSYLIPLVYGNGIKSGAVNSAAYTNGGGAYQADFVNHLGNTLTSPYIESNAGCSAASAGLLWQTAPGLITEVSLVGGDPCRFVKFKASAVPANNGVALLYIKDANGEIIWSWMIWLTGDDLTPVVITNATGKEYRLLPQNLGSIWGTNSRREQCTNVYFQWGRKDPMPPAAAYNSRTDAPLFDIGGNTFEGYAVSESASSISLGIKNPATFYKMTSSDYYYNWTTAYADNMNLWNSNCSNLGSRDASASDIKTIYDPCPTGYMVPAPRFPTGFTTTGENSSNLSQFNVIGSFANGWFFKRNESDTEGVFFPASGYRDDGRLYDVGTWSFYWTWGFWSHQWAHSLSLHETNVGAQNCNGRSSAFSLRPCQEP